jgi:hypothetical protein
MAHAFHQLTKVGSWIGGQLVAGVAQVMEMNVKSGRGQRRRAIWMQTTGACQVGTNPAGSQRARTPRIVWAGPSSQRCFTSRYAGRAYGAPLTLEPAQRA